MKILTKEEEQEHYNATLKGGITGGGIGLILVSSHHHEISTRPLTSPPATSNLSLPLHISPPQATKTNIPPNRE